MELTSAYQTMTADDIKNKALNTMIIIFLRGTFSTSGHFPSTHNHLRNGPDTNRMSRGYLTSVVDIIPHS